MVYLNFDEWFSWYKRPEVQWKILPYCYNREFALMERNKGGSVLTRNWRVNTLRNFQYQIECQIEYWYKKDGRPRFNNLYYSMGMYLNGVPMTSPHGEERRDFKEFWVMNHYKTMISYDMLIDVDSDSFDNVPIALTTAKNIKHLLDLCGVEYRQRFSGRGFHFVVPYLSFPPSLSMNPNIEGNLYQYMTDILKYMHDTISVMIDWRIADPRRICKIPYSIAVYPDDNIMTIAQPVRYLESFRIDKMMVGSPDSELNLRASEFVFNPNGKVNKLYDLASQNQEIPFTLEEVKR